MTGTNKTRARQNEQRIKQLTIRMKWQTNELKSEDQTSTRWVERKRNKVTKGDEKGRMHPKKHSTEVMSYNYR